jgi:hypothetical protein
MSCVVTLGDSIASQVLQRVVRLLKESEECKAADNCSHPLSLALRLRRIKVAE